MTDSQFDDDARVRVYLEQPPADVRTALHQADWWQIFTDWLPRSGQQTDWTDHLARLDTVGDFFADTSDEASAISIAGQLRDDAFVADLKDAFEELAGLQNDYAPMADAYLARFTDVYWRTVDALAYEYGEFLEAVAAEKAAGQPDLGAGASADDAGDDSPFSEDVRIRLYLEQPPADVYAAAYQSDWWQIFSDWLPVSGWQSDWDVSLAKIDKVGQFLSDTTDEAAAKSLAAELLDDPAVSDGRATLEEFVDEGNMSEYASYQEDVVSVLTRGYWRFVEALTEEYEHFLDVAAEEKAKGQPAAV